MFGANVEWSALARPGKGVGAPGTEVTAEMIEAGVAALDKLLLDGELVRSLRPDAVEEIYRVMRAIAQNDRKSVNVIRKGAKIAYIAREIV
jgi:hypothetical protein